MVVVVAVAVVAAVAASAGVAVIVGVQRYRFVGNVATISKAAAAHSAGRMMRVASLLVRAAAKGLCA